MKNKRIIPVLILLIIIVYLAIYIVYDIPQKNMEHYANTSKVVNKNTNVSNEVIENKVEPTKDETNPIPVGLYHYEKELSKRVLKKEYTASWNYHKDIISFNVFYTNEKEIPATKISAMFEKYASEYENSSDYRIGYIIEFNNLKVQILNPKDTESIYDTLEIYTYDAIAHKNDSWYSHVTTSDFNKNTLLEGIKLTAGKNISNITTDIKVTVFIYNDSDFDDNNNYVGNNTYSVIVKKA